VYGVSIVNPISKLQEKQCHYWEPLGKPRTSGFAKPFIEGRIAFDSLQQKFVSSIYLSGFGGLSPEQVNRVVYRTPIAKPPVDRLFKGTQGAWLSTRQHCT
jgi:hypothetical protein